MAPTNVVPLDGLMNDGNYEIIKTMSRRPRTEKHYPWQWRQKMLALPARMRDEK